MAGNRFRKNMNRLTRYFQGKTVVIPDKEGKVKLRTVDPKTVAMDHLWSSGFGSGSRGSSGLLSPDYYSNYTTPAHRQYLFREYMLMERDPIISRALDLVSSEVCMPDESNSVVQVKSDNEAIKTSLDYLFHEVLNVNFNLQSWVRQMIKYGDCFIYLNISDTYGITDAIPFSILDVERNEEEDGTYFTAQNVIKDKIPEERMIHFRLAKDAEFLPYGVSDLESVRRHWKQMTLLEDFMMVYYLMRSVNQRVFRVDVGNLAPKDVPSFVEKFQQMLKRESLVDEKTGEYDIRFDPMTVLEDVILPVREGYENTTFDEIPASTETTITEGIEYFRQKIMSGLGIPNFLLNYEEQINSRATASAEDLRFAKKVIGLQKIVLSELETIAVIHLILQGYSKKDIHSFELSLTNPSDLKEMEELEKLERKISIARDMIDLGMHNKEWIYENVFNTGEDEMKKLMDGVLEDKINDKLNEELVNKADLPEDEEPMEDDDGDSGESGEGSQGGMKPASSPDDEQESAGVGRADDLMKAGKTNDEPSREPREAGESSPDD